jgi:P27 family predicted phage terminase small subunit
LHGNPGKRPINNHEPKPELAALPPPCPEFLDDYARAEWKRVAPELFRLRLLTRVDVAVLAAYCFSYSQWRTAAETLKAMGANDPVMHGLLVKTEAAGVTANPLVWIAKGALRDMVRYASEFGMTPASRSTIATGVDPRPTKFGDLLQG